MLEMSFNQKEIESFIVSFYKENKDVEVTATLENGFAVVKSEDEQINLNSNDISFVLTEYFASQNLGISSMNFGNQKESPIFIKVTQLNRGDVRKLAIPA